MPVVKMPDGTLVDLPDNLSPEQVAALQKLTAQPAAKKPSEWSLRSLWDDAARGLGKSVAGIQDLAASAADTYAQANQPLDKRMGLKVGPDVPVQPRMITDASQAVEKQIPTPQTTSALRRYTRAGVEGVGGALVTPVGKPAAVVAGGVGGGLGSEVAANTLGDHPLSRFLGGLVGGVGGGVAATKLTTPRVNTATVAREAMEGLTEAQLQKAAAFQAAAKAKGIDLDLAQALSATGVDAGNLTTIRNALANRAEGEKVQAMFRGTESVPSQASKAVETTKEFIEGLPGQNFGMPQSALNMQEAATKRVGMEVKARTDAVRADYAQAGMLPPAAQQAVIAELQSVLKAPGTTQAARGVAEELLAKFKNAPQSIDSAAAAREAISKAMKPSEKLQGQARLANANAAEGATRPMHSLDANVALSDAMGTYKGSPTYLADPQGTGQVKGLAARVNEILKEGSPAIRKAEQKFRQISEEKVNPLKQGPVGEFATARGYLQDRSVTEARLAKLFNDGSDGSAKVSKIRTLGTELSKSDPDAFRDGFKAWISDKITSRVDPKLTPQQAQSGEVLKGIVNDLGVIGSSAHAKRWQGIRDAVAVIASNSGQDPNEVLRGLNNLGMMLKGAANRPGSIGGLQPSQLERMAGENLSANTLRIFGFLPFERAARGLEIRSAAATMRTFDDLLTSPEGAATLAQLGKVSAISPQARAVLQGFFVAGQVSDENAPGFNPQ